MNDSQEGSTHSWNEVDTITGLGHGQVPRRNATAVRQVLMHDHRLEPVNPRRRVREK